MNPQLFSNPVYLGLRALVGYINLDIAGVRRMTAAEERLADDIVVWWKARQAREAFIKARQ